MHIHPVFSVLILPAFSGILHAQSTIARQDTAIGVLLNTGASWVGGVVPGSADIALFDATMATANNSMNQIGGDITVKGLRIVDPKSVNVTSGYSISASSVTTPSFAYTGTLTLGASGIDMSSAVALAQHTNSFFVINPPLVLTADQTWDVPRLSTNPGRELSINGNTSATARRTADLDLAGHVLTKQGTGIAGVYFDRTTKDGTIRINGGTFFFANAQNSATNTNIIQDVPASLTVEVNPGGTLHLAQAPTAGTGALNWNAGVLLNGGTLQLNGPNYTGQIAPGGTLSAAALTVSDVLYNNTATAAAAIFPTLKSTLTGAGTLRINMTTARTQDRLRLAGNDSTFSGIIRIVAGHVLVTNTSGGATGTGELIVDAGAILGGNGRTGPLRADGTLRPGIEANDTVTLSTGPATLRGTFTADIAGPASDVLDVTGPLDVSTATLNLVLSGAGFTASSYVIARADSITGEFASVTAGYQVGIVTRGARQELVVSAAPAGAYQAWAQTHITAVNPAAPAGFDADADTDGVANGLEWILGGDPLSGSSPPAPAPSRDAQGNFILTFTREDTSVAGSTLLLDYDTDLTAPWAKNAAIGATSSGPDANGVAVAVNAGATPGQITVTIPAANAPDGHLFARLRAQLQ